MAWLQTLLPFELQVEQVCERLTDAGIEVGSVEPAAPSFHGVHVARILAAEPLAEGSHLLLCRLQVGQDTCCVVTGAPNARPGLLAPLARPGALLPNERRIEASTFRGIVSEGMLCSSAELGLDDDDRGLMELAPDVSVGEDLRLALGLDGDLVITLELTPNRADCLSVLGVARELAALWHEQGRSPLLPACQELILQNHGPTMPVSVEATDGCLAYAGRLLSIGKQDAFTPSWMRERLRRSGMRCIHPIVDITNHVMLETGQPLHAFDAGRLQPPITIRWARPGETIVLLDGRTMALQQNMLVVADGSESLALAGIMGGALSAVRPDTRDVFLESALFAPQAVRSALRCGAPHTEASHRFERGVARTGQRLVLDRASALLQEWVGAAAGPMSAHGLQQPLPAFAVNARHVAQRLGYLVERQEIVSILERVGAQSEILPQEEELLVTAPAHRWDMIGEVDVVEEVARLKGYQHIPRRLQPPLGGTMASLAQVSLRQMAQQLVHRGFFEVINYSFTSRAMQQMTSDVPALPLANPLSEDGAVLRTSLLPGLLGVLRHNVSYRRGMVHIFELGTVFHDRQDALQEANHLGMLMAGDAWPEQWGAARRLLDFYDLKGEVEALLDTAGHFERRYVPLGDHPLLHPGQAASIVCPDGRLLGILGTLHPRHAADLQLEEVVVLAELYVTAWQQGSRPVAQLPPRFPAMRRDISLLVPEQVSAALLMESCRRHGGALLEDMVLFDVFRGKGVDAGLKSIAIGLSFRDRRHTLDDRVVQERLHAIICGLQAECGAELRATHDHHQG
jgi:phenylalanyl-tRNA synthetase beta chain